MLRILDNAKSISSAQELLREQLVREAATSTLHKVGWQGGGDELETHWHSGAGFWAAFVELPNRYWNAFGLERPDTTPGSLSLTVEINPPRHGLDRQIAGAFAESENGGLFLVHRGGVGGGKKGVGRVAFLEWTREELELVRDGDRESPVLVLAEIGAPELADHLAAFLDKVTTFKAMAGKGLIPPTRPGQQFSYSPEFEGTAPLPPSPGRTARFRHGTVIRVLRRRLSEMGFESFNDAQRDLFLPAENGRPPVLFEAKCSADRQSVYTAVGQLTLHAEPEAGWVRVAVLPHEVSGTLRAALETRGVRVLAYDWVGSSPRFHGLQDLLAGGHSTEMSEATTVSGSEGR